MQLKKINQDHYIVVDSYKNVECKADGYSYDDKGRLLPIIASTNKLDDVIHLDLSSVKELIGEVDVEKKAEKYATNHGMMAYIFPEKKEGYITGYNQCKEDNKDKRFSEEDVRMAIDESRKYPYIKKGEIKFEKSVDEILNYITQPKDSWEVEFDENNNLKLK